MNNITKVGVIGCGNISNAYFKAAKTFNFIKYAYCADLNMEAAKAKEELYGCKAVSVSELLMKKEVKIVLNLTTPQAHAKVNIMALEANKHVYAEKPFALSMDEGVPVIELAKKKNLRIGSAPDTFLGGGIQTVRKLIDENWIGTPVSGTAFMMCPGHESWHPAPEFYYLSGGGPLFDMGPYYITALINLLGSVKKVTAITGRGFDERTCTSEARFGAKLPVEINSHVAGLLEFECGAIITLIMSFDVAKSSCPCIELHGTAGSLSVPDPNSFGGPVKFAKARRDWQEVPIPFGYTDNMRSIGLADMAKAIRDRRKHRCSGELAFHVLDVMCALEKSAAEEKHIYLKSSCERPAALPLGLLHGEID
ncbi:MAG: Gfo/Idh/MocA family oxidoreductase [Victivallaceae bacterium]